MSQQLAIMTGFAMHYVLCKVFPYVPVKVRMKLWEISHNRNQKKLYKNSTWH